MGGTVNKNQITDQGSPFNVIKGSCRTLCATEGLKGHNKNLGKHSSPQSKYVQINS